MSSNQDLLVSDILIPSLINYRTSTNDLATFVDRGFFTLNNLLTFFKRIVDGDVDGLNCHFGPSFYQSLASVLPLIEDLLKKQDIKDMFDNMMYNELAEMLGTCDEELGKRLFYQLDPEDQNISLIMLYGAQEHILDRIQNVNDEDIPEIISQIGQINCEVDQAIFTFIGENLEKICTSASDVVRIYYAIHGSDECDDLIEEMFNYLLQNKKELVHEIVSKKMIRSKNCDLKERYVEMYGDI